jgi:hypothetical protein
MIIYLNNTIYKMQIFLFTMLFIIYSAHAYQFYLYGTSQHKHPLSFNLFQKIQFVITIITLVYLLGWLWGVLSGILFFLFSATIFMPIAILLHLLHGINLIKTEIPKTLFPWDILTIIIEIIWLVSIFTLGIGLLFIF